jgi:excisionase family DNA binding protein
MVDVVMLTIAEVAKQLGVGDNLIRSAIASGKLKAVRLGHRTVRITQGAVDDYVLNQSDCFADDAPPITKPKRKAKRHV